MSGIHPPPGRMIGNKCIIFLICKITGLSRAVNSNELLSETRDFVFQVSVNHCLFLFKEKRWGDILVTLVVFLGKFDVENEDKS